LVFFPFAALKGRHRFIVGAFFFTAILLMLSFIFIPDWLLGMRSLLLQGGQRTDNNWNFTTLPNLLGYQENWSGTANLPFTIILFAMGIFGLWNVRQLPPVPLLSLALTASLFCAPRAYAYNLPLIIPSMIWLSAHWSKPVLVLFWIAAGVLPLYFRYSSATYLIILIVFIAGLYKAYAHRHDLASPS
jgi:hypothetical protein